MSLRMAETIGSAVREARRRAGLTQEQVAEAIELNPLAFSRLERGKLLPSVPTLALLSQVLKTPTDVLLGASGVGA
ncbi:helix-turn-helix transcriptional regulator [Hyalangium rubrum]|jgi:transcriptional regulator with XRE-family HTH domain|uniref:Helix-turn-helix transcriptional regulator n=1 Tax=Hyalangium rubrum TaxID=3103134 RepID=A0ABU5H8N2_9BACT|nr:helix-turn-helix transcriptional regulator [Hyalangium sp. s54d21]MDY7229835.1 helix-turn-helix transcriptional regulator [Hyalangium sp. s54d21]